MQLRLLLAATILIALGAIGVSHFIVRPHIANILAARDGNCFKKAVAADVRRRTDSAVPPRHLGGYAIF